MWGTSVALGGRRAAAAAAGGGAAGAGPLASAAPPHKPQGMALDAALTQPRVLLFKHSPICPISLVAQSQLKMFQLDHPDALTMTVNVIGERAIAREIANLCEIEHQSPQAILFESGSATWHACHTAITAESLSAAWSPKS